MVKYREYTDDSGIGRVVAYSDNNMMIERDGEVYSEADDFAYQERKYTETDIPIEGDTGDLTVTDTLRMLNQMGVSTDD